MSSTIEYLGSLQQLNLGEYQKAFYTWQASVAKQVEVCPTKDAAPCIHRKIKRCKVFPKMCYANSYKIARLNPGVEFVLGYVNCMDVPIEHAWNRFNGVHFDVTFERIAKFVKMVPAEYTQISIVPMEKIDPLLSHIMNPIAIAYAMETGHAKNLFERYIERTQ